MVTLCKWASGAQVERELSFSLNLCTERPLTESDHTRCSINKILPPDNEHEVARNI